jgi:hypothetical protein
METARKKLSIHGEVPQSLKPTQPTRKVFLALRFPKTSAAFVPFDSAISGQSLLAFGTANP